MKKLLAVALAALSVFSVSTTAFAMEDVAGYTVTDLDVTVTAGYTGTANYILDDYGPDEIEQAVSDISHKDSEPVVYVEVSWEDLHFVYDFGTVAEYKWNVNTLKYDPVFDYVNVDARGWVDDDAEITFENRSNRDVYAGTSFEKNAETDVYDDVTVSFDKEEVLLLSAAGRGIQSDIITMTVAGEPSRELFDAGREAPALGKLKFYISEQTRTQPVTPDEPEVEEPDGEHQHHWVYDQFGRLVCTGCNAIKHEYCIDEDEDGLCDECGMERDFCPDCHRGGTCVCT